MVSWVGLIQKMVPAVPSQPYSPRLADALSQSGFNDADVLGIMGQNWLTFFRRALPADAR